MTKTRHSLSRRSFMRAVGSGAAAACIGCESRVRRAFLGPLAGPWDQAQMVSFASSTDGQVDLISHVIARLTWGAAPGDYERIAALGATQEAAVEKFIQMHLGERHGGEALASEQQVPMMGALLETPGELFDNDARELRAELTRASVLRAVHSPNQLYEIMVSFWSDHFNIDSTKSDCRWLKPHDDRTVIRQHALSKFSDLVKSSALSPAMLVYLDGRENKRSHPAEKPNENYARELLELHTLGADAGYTQMDVFEAARCLTGWTVMGRESRTRGIGRVKFVASRHDNGAKKVLGHQIAAGGGEKDLDSLLAIVTTHPQTSKFIATKLCRRFIADDPPAAAIQATAQAFLASQGDIPRTLMALCKTEAFLTARRSKFKRPYHFIVSCLRATGLPHDGMGAVQVALRRMGQLPFEYPTPEGYSERAEDWMSTLLARWDFALRLSRGQLGVSNWKSENLLHSAGGATGLARHILGRQSMPDESAAIEATPERDRLALLLSMPGFQYY